MSESVEWARENAIHFDSLGPSPDNLARLAALDQSLRGKRIVYLGEPDHFIHEKYAYRLMLISYLVSRGWRVVCEEMGFSDGQRIDRFIETGDESHLNRVSAYGYRGSRRADRNDEPTGILKSAFSSAYPAQEFRNEQTEFARQLHRIGQSAPDRRIKFFGFDVDYLPGGGYEDVAEILAPLADQTLVRSIMDALERVAGETREQEIARLDAARELLRSNLPALKQIVGERAAQDVADSVDTLRDSLRYIETGYFTESWKQLNEAMALRELVMHRYFANLLARSKPDEKFIVMSHNLHLVKDLRLIRNPTYGAGPGGGREVAVGTFINDRAPGEVFSVWMLFDHGTDSQPFAGLSKTISSPPDSLNALLARVGETFLLPLSSDDPRKSTLTAEIKVVMDGGVPPRIALAPQADAIFFVRAVGPLRAGS